jgi:hypothetical protein
LVRPIRLPDPFRASTMEALKADARLVIPVIMDKSFPILGIVLASTPIHVPGS